jgi:glucose/arabinose dehydrogenase
LSVEVVVKNLDIPWALAFAPDGRFFITERPGRVRIVKNSRLLPDPWMTFAVYAHPGDEAGLLGLALDPQFAQNHYVYVVYTYTSNGKLFNRLVRLRDDPLTDKGVQDKVLLDGVLGGNDHDGGRIAFGPDGKLYWAVGETFQRQLAQALSSLNGKILRLNADGTVPTDNPFPGSPIYVYGVRNPEGLAWQPATGRLYETENGPSGEKGFGQDEINYIEPGKNYGWPVISGAETHTGMESPIVQSGNQTWAPSGATFVTGGPWNGSFLFTGLRGGSLYRLILDPDDPRKVLSFETLLAGQLGRLRDVVQGPDGALYILTSNRDGRGQPLADDDRLLRLVVK